MNNKKTCANLYGPVPSRRLGFSLGVDFIPFKTCNLDCIYCQLGHVPDKIVTRKDYIPASEILSQIKEKIDSGVRIDYITFSGSGEPTLNTGIGKLIRGIKKLTKIPVAVLTNSTLLQHNEVRKALSAANLVVPSLDAVTQDVFEKINRPHPSLKVKDIISGLKKFRREFKGKIWIEVLLVKGINDSPLHLKKLKTVLEELHPDRVQLNSVVRPPAESFARPLSLDELEEIRDFIGGRCEIIATFDKTAQNLVQKSEEESILSMIQRRPMTLVDLASSLGLHRNEVMKQLQILDEKGDILLIRHKGSVYYEPAKK
jgi:wyosine [tRNA(Phe)-imidazoG37] synthetase (radical SAM superfamily)